MRNFTIRGKKIPVALLALMLVLSGAGAAAGVTFDGNVEGDAISKVDQAIVVDDVSSGDATGQNLGKVSDDSTKFRFAANVRQGEDYTLEIVMNNTADETLNGVLTLNVPAPLEVEAHSSSSTLSLARTSMSTWNFEKGSGTSTLEITVAIPDDAQPGFYTIEGDIRPAEV